MRPVPPPVQHSASPGSHLTRRTFMAGGAAAALVGLYSNEVARHHIEVTHRTFLLPNLPPAFRGFRFAQISDIHLEEFTEDFFLRDVIERVNGLKPDLVLITGDFITRGPFSAGRALECAGLCGELLRSLTAPQRFGILGNHDMIVGQDFVRMHMENTGTPMLVNQSIKLQRGSDHLWLAGLDDTLIGHPDLDRTLPRTPDAPVILMCHEPDYLQTIAGHPGLRSVDLVLSGHTHGGQIRFPGIRPLALPPGGKLYPEGHYQLGNLQLYVNRGIGTVGLPFRLNCPPEITLATLQPA